MRWRARSNASTESRLQNTPELLTRLADAQVEFVVIGGVAAIAWGSQQFTRDLDLAVPMTAPNVDCLGEVPPLGRFDDVARSAVELELFGKTCRVIALDDLITVKHFVGRPTDRLVEAELRAVRERLRPRR